MLTNITSLTGNGLKDWLIQRASAVYFALYCFFMVGFFATHPNLQFESWHALFSRPLVQGATVVGLLALVLHSWVGIWTVVTDYIKCTVIRLSIQLAVALWLISQLIWGIMIVWGHQL